MPVNRLPIRIVNVILVHGNAPFCPIGTLPYFIINLLIRCTEPSISKVEFEAYVRSNPNFTTADMGKYFNISNPGALYYLRKFGFSYKKTFSYVEANEEKRQKYQELIQDIPNTNLVYIDESGVDTRICKDRGRGKKSEKLLGKKSGKSYQRTHIIAGYVNRKPIAPMVFNGSCNTNLFEKLGRTISDKGAKTGSSCSNGYCGIS